MKQLKGKTAVITGAAGGIGHALASELANEGMNLALIDWDEVRLGATASDLDGAPGKVTTHKVDVSNALSIATARASILEQHGAVHLLVNGAGITLQKSFAAHETDDWNQVLAINLGGPVAMTRAFLPDLRLQSEAHILNISSMAGFLGLPTQSSYSASKAALTAFGEALRVELASEGIGVTTALPGTIKTDLIQRTLERSENLEIAEKIVGGMQMVGMAPQKTARKMIRAIRRNKGRARIGLDAYLTDWIVRLHPPLLLGPLSLAYRKILRR